MATHPPPPPSPLLCGLRRAYQVYPDATGAVFCAACAASFSPTRWFPTGSASSAPTGPTAVRGCKEASCPSSRITASQLSVHEVLQCNTRAGQSSHPVHLDPDRLRFDVELVEGRALHRHVEQAPWHLFFGHSQCSVGCYSVGRRSGSSCAACLGTQDNNSR